MNKYDICEEYLRTCMKKNNESICSMGFLRRSDKIMVFVCFNFIAALLISSSTAAYSQTNSSSLLLPPLSKNGIQCNTTEHLLFHVHAHLDIIVNGQYFLIPSQIGIIPGKCIYWLHTHDVTGVIHIESPINRDFTLGQFFDIWNKKFNNSQIFDYMSNNTNTLSVFVNGTKVQDGTNYRDIKLHPHDEIAIVYGIMSSATIPSNYDFPQGL